MSSPSGMIKVITTDPLFNSKLVNMGNHCICSELYSTYIVSSGEEILILTVAVYTHTVQYHVYEY